MNCTHVNSLLSPFHDGELPWELRQQIGLHLDSCASCSAQLESLRRLTDLVESSPPPDVPSTLVTRIERSLSGPSSRWERFAVRSPEKVAAAFAFAIAAIILLSLVFWPSADATGRRREEMFRNFNQFLTSFERGDPAAAEYLVQKYQGVVASEVTVNAVLKRPTSTRPVALTDHQIANRYVLKMPCCKCVQTVYACGGATSFVVLEHETDEAGWFGQRPMIRANCHGKNCSVVQLNGCLAGSWPVEGGFVTVIGLRDIDEFNRLVAEFSGATKS